VQGDACLDDDGLLIIIRDIPAAYTNTDAFWNG